MPSYREISQQVIEIVAADLEIDKGKIQLTSRLKEDLGADSVDFVSVISNVERGFKIRFQATPDVSEVPTVEMLTRYVADKLGVAHEN